jgi:hypothetical protein
MGGQDFWMGSSEPVIPIEERIELRGTQMKVYFPRPRAKKLIPVYGPVAVQNAHFSRHAQDELALDSAIPDPVPTIPMPKAPSGSSRRSRSTGARRS